MTSTHPTSYHVMHPPSDSLSALLLLLLLLLLHDCTHSPLIPHMSWSRASYTRRDLILYALSLGYGSTKEDYESDLRFTWEEGSLDSLSTKTGRQPRPHMDHDSKKSDIRQDSQYKNQHRQHGNASSYCSSSSSLQAVPTFCLTLPFWAQDPSTSPVQGIGIPPFPPPFMHPIIPKHLQRPGSASTQDLPVLHTFQSLTLYRPLPVPSDNSSHISVELRSRCIQVTPKTDLGVFCTSETTVTHQWSPVATMKSTVLLLGMDASTAIPFHGTFEADPLPPSIPTHDPTGTHTLTVSYQQALLYRMTSGDSNHLHVIGNDTEDPPILHGLCTLGWVLRDLWRNECAISRRRELGHLQARFTHPIRLGETIQISWWALDSNRTVFVVDLLLVTPDDPESIPTRCVSHGYAVWDDTLEARSKL